MSTIDEQQNELKTLVELCMSVVYQETYNILKYRCLLKFQNTKMNGVYLPLMSFSRLSQGVVGKIKGMDTNKFTAKSEVPNDGKTWCMEKFCVTTN